MKYKLLSIMSPEIVNIGDYIQALASRQFLPNVYGFVERDELKSYGGEECAIIMNGWYMHNPQQWPPSGKIHPLYVSVHLNKLSKSIMLQGEGLEHFKRYEPIGCRDYYTVNNFKSNGIKAYFSGCMTLTLGQTYRYEGKRKGIYFVDADALNLNSLEIPWLFFKSLFRLRIVYTLYRKNWRYVKPWRHWVNMTKFYIVYSKVFDKQSLLSATYVSQQSPYFKEHYKTNEELIRCADELLKKYARAEMVVTSRIHCALPCTGMGTPVIYVDNVELGEVHRCRLDGLLQLFNTLPYKNGCLDTSMLRIDHSKKISPSNMPPQKENWKPFAENLVKKCREWVKDTSESNI